MRASTFQSLIVWQKGHQFVLDVYRKTKNFPEDERFTLVSQMRRSAISITANIAEGYRKIGKKDKLRFFNTSQGSLSETYNYLILSRDLRYITDEEFTLLENQISEVDKILNAYCSKISKDVKLNVLSFIPLFFLSLGCILQSMIVSHNSNF